MSDAHLFLRPPGVNTHEKPAVRRTWSGLDLGGLVQHDVARSWRVVAAAGVDVTLKAFPGLEPRTDDECVLREVRESRLTGLLVVGTGPDGDIEVIWGRGTTVAEAHFRLAMAQQGLLFGEDLEPGE